jgi:hypothetical protein
VTRHAQHSIEHPFVTNAARPKLSIHHQQPHLRECGSFVRGIHAEFQESASGTILFLALPDADIEADHAVLIARAHHRNISIDVVFALNDLLGTL